MMEMSTRNYVARRRLGPSQSRCNHSDSNRNAGVGSVAIWPVRGTNTTAASLGRRTEAHSENDTKFRNKCAQQI
jgi:hypothetical protein